ncbi:DUF1289 domain-containing protein [Vibrio sp. Isolate23]|uniref:DUF1289 domain-containing protein n=1 Tax=Vibrio sp. Isolate23 TaxID=2908533 RepID=UPI001EFE7F2F|nr:DUF1289 domain-containing protein [Vibrio sp. Isolate23]MCG9682175.1 DUF1289 domain-containing protein [Vibrio sp. Isolate23]
MKTVVEKVPIPCVRNCCLDGDDICLGCFRTLNEILEWRSYTDEEKRAVLVSCAERRKKRSR